MLFEKALPSMYIPVSSLFLDVRSRRIQSELADGARSEVIIVHAGLNLQLHRIARYPFAMEVASATAAIWLRPSWRGKFRLGNRAGLRNHQ